MRPQVQHGDNLTEWIDGNPEPEGMRSAAQPGAEFVELNMGQVEVVEPAVVERWAAPRGYRTRAGKPGRNRRVPMAKHPSDSRDIEAFREGEDFTHALGGRFEAIQGGVAACAERDTHLAPGRLDAFVLPVFPMRWAAYRD